MSDRIVVLHGGRGGRRRSTPTRPSATTSAPDAGARGMSSVRGAVAGPADGGLGRSCAAIRRSRAPRAGRSSSLRCAARAVPGLRRELGRTASSGDAVRALRARRRRAGARRAGQHRWRGPVRHVRAWSSSQRSCCARRLAPGRRPAPAARARRCCSAARCGPASRPPCASSCNLNEALSHAAAELRRAVDPARTSCSGRGGTPSAFNLPDQQAVPRRGAAARPTASPELHLGILLALVAAVVVWVIARPLALGLRRARRRRQPRGRAARRPAGQPHRVRGAADRAVRSPASAGWSSSPGSRACCDRRSASASATSASSASWMVAHRPIWIPARRSLLAAISVYGDYLQIDYGLPRRVGLHPDGRIVLWSSSRTRGTATRRERTDADRGRPHRRRPLRRTSVLFAAEGETDRGALRHRQPRHGGLDALRRAAASPSTVWTGSPFIGAIAG